MTARHRAFDEGAGGTSVSEEIAGPQRDVLWLVVHVLAAGGEQREREDEGTERERFPDTLVSF
jgi:hypothetical protein